MDSVRSSRRASIAIPSTAMCFSSSVAIEALHWDGTGLTFYAKRLERGRFASVWAADPDAPITLTISELDLFFDGSALIGRVPLTPPALTDFSLASDPDS